MSKFERGETTDIGLWESDRGISGQLNQPTLDALNSLIKDSPEGFWVRFYHNERKEPGTRQPDYRLRFVPKKKVLREKGFAPKDQYRAPRDPGGQETPF